MSIKNNELWRAKLLLLLIFSLLIPGFARTQEKQENEEQRIELIHAERARGSIAHGKVVRRLNKDVHLKIGDTHIRCDEAVEFPNEKRWRLKGHVHIYDAEKDLRADEVTWSQASRLYQATGNAVLVTGASRIEARRLLNFADEKKIVAEDSVEITNRDEMIRVTAQHAVHMQKDGWSRLTENPVLVQFDSTGAEVTRLLGEVMESDQKKKKYTISRNVRIFHDDIRATAEQALFLPEQDRIILFENPVAFQDKHKLEGDSLEIYLEKRQIKSIHVIGNAKATLLSDTTRSGDADTLTGRELFAYIDQSVLHKINVQGTATSVYRFYENEVYKGVNRIQGDQITLFLRANSVWRVKIDSDPGKSTGTFTPPGLPSDEKKTESSSSSKSAQEKQRRKAGKR